MLGLLLIFSFWVAITILIVAPLILTFALGSVLAQKLELDGLSYLLFMILFYLIILITLIII